MNLKLFLNGFGSFSPVVMVTERRSTAAHKYVITLDMIKFNNWFRRNKFYLRKQLHYFSASALTPSDLTLNNAPEELRINLS